jgi:hypothetical protein
VFVFTGASVAMVSAKNIPCTTEALTNASVKSSLCVTVSPSKYLLAAVYYDF